MGLGARARGPCQSGHRPDPSPHMGLLHGVPDAAAKPVILHHLPDPSLIMSHGKKPAEKVDLEDFHDRLLWGLVFTVLSEVQRKFALMRLVFPLRF